MVAIKKTYLTYFEPYFDVQVMETAYNSIEPRAENELFMILKKKAGDLNEVHTFDKTLTVKSCLQRRLKCWINCKLIKKINRIAYHIYEDNYDEKELIVAGISGRGFILADLIASKLESISDLKIHPG